MERQDLYRVFVSCMAAVLSGQPLSPLSLTPQEWGQLYSLAKRQSLSGALFTVADGMEMPDTVRDRLRRDAFLTMARYEGQQAILKDLAEILSAADIAHVFFKGAVVRRYYPDPAMRSMGDIDAVIREEDRNRTDRVLKTHGYECKEESPDVWVYAKNGVLIEMHTVVRRFNALTQEAERYEDLWTDVRLKKGSTYHLSDRAEIVMCIAHLTSHFCAGGCGLRQLMDVAVLYRRFPDADLWQGATASLRALGVDVFAKRLLWLCREWFDSDVPSALTVTTSADIEQALLERLLSDGTFGNADRAVIARVRKERRLGKGGGKAATLMRWAFPSAEYMRRRYAYAKSPLLLPMAYAHRLVKGVTTHRKTHIAHLKYADERQDELENEIALFALLGL